MPLGTRLSGTLPVSVAVHLLIFGLVLVVPLVADMTIPAIVVSTPAYVRALPVPAPPPPARERTPSARQPSPSSTAYAPVVAPTGITPERDVAAPDVPEIEGAIGTGVGLDVGVVVRDAPRVLEAAPPAARPAAAVRVADLPQPPHKIADARPVYPEVARSARIEGTVVLEAIIDRAGRIDDVRVVRSVPLLDQAALDAVRQWRYTPSTLRGQPVAVLMTITVNFKLQ